MTCTRTAYESKNEARAARRTIAKRYQMGARETDVCANCFKYHVEVILGHPVNEQWKKILELLAQGYEQDEIAKQIGVTPRSAEWRIATIRDHFYAMNRPHLIFITTALGLIQPNNFIEICEEQHA